MGAFKAFETEAIRLLAADVLSTQVQVEQAAALDDYGGENRKQYHLKLRLILKRFLENRLRQTHLTSTK